MRSSTYESRHRQRLLSASSVGNKSPTLSHLAVRDIGGYQMELVVRGVNQRLYDDSTFFSANRTQELPQFNVEEIELGPNELGRGEFGIVYQVDALNPKSCECPKCLLKSLYDTPEDRHKLAAKELDVLEEGGEEGEEDAIEHTNKPLHQRSNESSTMQTSQSTPVQDNSNPKSQLPNTKEKHNKRKSDSDEIVQWTDDVERSLNDMFGEESEEEQHDKDLEGEDDNVSDLSSENNSLIRPNAQDREDLINTKSLRENFNTYRKCFMQRNCIRQGRSRYAVKRLRGDMVEGETKYNAAIDLAVEAKFLAVLKHPNIVRVRATVGRPGHDSFMIMMDCLNLTLREKIVEWDYDAKILRNATANVLKRIFHVIGNIHHHQPDDSSKINPAMRDVHTEKLMASYDLVRGMKFLHSNKVLYRDLKPENIAFDVRGRLKIFDLGLAKELKAKELMEPPDGYKATGLTGSRRYMAPEVVSCKNYGFAADVYSYSIVIWEIFSGKIAYEEMDFNSHFEEVVMKEKRPSIKLYGIPKTLITLMQNAWDPDPLRRVDFKYVRQILKHECKLLNHDHIEDGHHHHLSNRTDYLMRQSARSQTNNENC